MPQSRIRVLVSKEIKAQVDRYMDTHGMKTGALVEQAMAYYLRAMRELPADIVVASHPRVSQPSIAGGRRKSRGRQLRSSRPQVN